MLAIFLILYVLAHIAPPVALAVSIMTWCSLHVLLTILILLFFA